MWKYPARCQEKAVSLKSLDVSGPSPTWGRVAFIRVALRLDAAATPNQKYNARMSLQYLAKVGA